MSEEKFNIKTYSFDTAGELKQKKYKYGSDWPVVYFLYNKNTLYIGETTSASTRMHQHLGDKEKQKENFSHIKIIYDESFNKSVVLDYEQRLIKSCKTDGKFKRIINDNNGQLDSHNYFDRPKYKKHFNKIWSTLKKQKLVNKSLDIIENENLFKYSPYTSLSIEQKQIMTDVLNDIADKLIGGNNGTSLIEGCSGTGKTVLGINLIYNIVNAINIDETSLSEDQKIDPLNIARLRIKKIVNEGRNIKVAMVFPMSGIRSVIANVFKDSGNGLCKRMVISPFNIAKEHYDILVVDESHRLMRKKNLPRTAKAFNETCAHFKLDPSTANQLDWIMLGSQYKVLFYDEDQSIRSSDIPHKVYFESLAKTGESIITRELTSQMRCEGGDSYIEYVKSIMDCKQSKKLKLENDYSFYIFDDVEKMINAIRQMDGKYNCLCKTVAGFSWEWKTHQDDESIPDNMDRFNELKKKKKYDIDIEGHKYIWNLTTTNWVTRKDSKYTIGCIHTIQGFDLNFVGVIFGKEIDYNPSTNKIEVDLTQFFDSNVKNGCDVDTVKKYIINTYTTMLARGIKGCYVYACNKNLQEYLKRFIEKEDDGKLAESIKKLNIKKYDSLLRDS